MFACYNLNGVNSARCGERMRDNKIKAQALRFVQIGDGPSLRGLLNDWMEQAAGEHAYQGTAVFTPVSDEQKACFEQNGQYAIYTTGIGKNGRAVKKDVRTITQLYTPDEWDNIVAAASQAELQAILTDTINEAPASSKNDDLHQPRSLAGRVAALLYARYRKELKGITVYCFEPVKNNAKRLQLAVMALAIEWALPEGFLKWFMEDNVFISCYADRAIEVAVEKETGHSVLRAEGFGKVYVSDASVPPFLMPLKKAGKEIITSIDAYSMFEDEQTLWAMILWSSSLLADALSASQTNAPAYDDDLRTWIGHLMLNEYLPAQKIRNGLKPLAESMERLENEFYQTPPSVLQIDYFFVFRQNVLTAVKNNRSDGRPCERLVFMMALMIVESIIRHEKRFHALSSDMEPEMLTYAVLSDQALWEEDIRAIDGLEPLLASAIRDLQLLGTRETILRIEKSGR